MSSSADCPICATPALPGPLLPFCSARCRDRDLLNWLSDRYALPADGEPGEPDEDRPVDGIK
ncbi:MAG: DNA gyrase inhibitor YacG [Sphingomonadaceae bacterium]|nr:DNA gyrase inhibitor YacG [Sphingomonadaceae bacterium]